MQFYVRKQQLMTILRQSLFGISRTLSVCLNVKTKFQIHPAPNSFLRDSSIYKPSFGVHMESLVVLNSG